MNNRQNRFRTVDAFSSLVVLLVKTAAETAATTASGASKVTLLNRVLAITVLVMTEVFQAMKQQFPQKPFFRFFMNLLFELNAPDKNLDQVNFKILVALADTFHTITPSRIPTFAFSWLELVSHRMFMPKLLLLKGNKGWPFFQRLLVGLLKFLSPFLRSSEMTEPVRFLYRGTLRVLLVLLHDFPEFLCDYHASFCDVIPASCIQLRNLILSAFPRNMRLPDPFTPNLKVDLLPEIQQPPRILSNYAKVLQAAGGGTMKKDVDTYIKTRGPVPVLFEIRSKLYNSPAEQAAGNKFNVPLINALVLYVGAQAVAQQAQQAKSSPQSSPITHSAPMDIFQQLAMELEPEGRYYFFNAIVNQLRYPNSHTYYFSCVLLYLFAEAGQELVQEQITRVLLERLIVNRPHPWGLLITFIELIKNPRYNFWSHGFTRCAPEIEKLFESVARSCMILPGKGSSQPESLQQ